MKHLPFFLICLILLCAFGCGSKQPSIESDPLALYRDILKGNFNGLEIDTLIAEPIDTTIDRSLWNWRIYGKKNTVDTLILSHRFNVRLIHEGDLDGNGTDEWGYVTEWETSNWMRYHAFTNKRGKWEHIIEPINIWLPHLDPQDSISYRISKEDILQPSDNSGFLKVKFSDVRNDGEDFLIIDTMIMLNHKY